MLAASRTLLFPVVLLSVLFSILFGCEAAPARRQTKSFSQTALVIATSATAGDEATSIINGLGQQFQLLAVSQGGTPLPALETTGPSGTVGNFGLIVIVGFASYNYGGSTGWASAITTDQLTALYAYQVKYGVRMIHLDGYPGNFDGTAIAPGPGGCCSGDEQLVYVSDATLAPPTGPVSNSTLGLWHYPSTITNATTTTAFLEFGANAEYPSTTVAGVIQSIIGREQMVFFLTGASWSSTSKFLGQVWFHWGYQLPFNSSSPSSSTSASGSTITTTSSSSSTPTNAQAVVSPPYTALVIASSASAADEAVSILNALGQPNQLLAIAQSGTPLPPLETVRVSTTTGNFGLIIIIGMVSYNYGGTTGWASAITSDQWTALYAYQLKYGVRMVHLDGYPGNFPGTTSAPGPGGCCSSDEQDVYATDTSLLTAAGLPASNLSTLGLWHYPATVTDATITTSFLQFAPNTEYVATTVAGVTQNFAGREQMVLFITGGSWSSTTNYLGHIWFSWGYRGLSASATSSISTAVTTTITSSTSTTSTAQTKSTTSSISSTTSTAVSTTTGTTSTSPTASTSALTPALPRFSQVYSGYCTYTQSTDDLLQLNITVEAGNEQCAESCAGEIAPLD